MKIEKTEAGYSILDATREEAEMIVAGLVSYEDITMRSVGEMMRAGATTENSLALDIRVWLARRAVMVGKQIVAVMIPDLSGK